MPHFHLIQRSTLILLGCSISLVVYANNAQISIEGHQRCISANGLPDHSTGQFPNRGNPHTISTQHIHYCFPIQPTKNNTPRPQHGSIGVALNGITIRPGTADYWDASSHRGHSRDRRSGWNLEGLGSRELLGMDNNNAHVDNTGLYHYHGIADALVQSTAHKGTLIGYAADGFEIHYVSSQTSSYQLKMGARPSGPGGRYDGSYNEDWQYVAGSGTLDPCNGGQLNGHFVYFATKTYPFFPRCLWGNASSDFSIRHGSQNMKTNHLEHPTNNHHSNTPKHKHPQRGHRKPPAEALSACSSQAAGDVCSFSLSNQSLNGHCRIVRNGEKVCVPSRSH